jgi:hypothetical protein
MSATPPQPGRIERRYHALGCPHTSGTRGVARMGVRAALECNCSFIGGLRDVLHSLH